TIFCPTRRRISFATSSAIRNCAASPSGSRGANENYRTLVVHTAFGTPPVAVRHAISCAALCVAVSRHRSAGLSGRHAVRPVPVAGAGGDRGEHGRGGARH